MSQIYRLIRNISFAGILILSVFTKAFATSIPLPGAARAGSWGANSFAPYIKGVFNWLVLIAGVIFIIMFLIGGIQYLTSAGNEEAAGKAKKLLIDAVIGIIITTGAYVAGSYVIGQIGGTMATGF